MNAPAVAPLSKADEGHLDLLGVLYWCYGALFALTGVGFALFALIPILALAFTPAPKHGGGPPPALIGGILLVVFVGVAALLVAKGLVLVFVGSSLRKRRNYVFCMIGAALAVINMPLGTALAVFTFVVLNKPEAKQRFAT